MISALVLMNVEKSAVNTVAETLADMDGVQYVYSVAGRYDLAAVIRVKDHEAVADLVTGQMLKVSGITKSETLIAFRVFSREDQEGIFSIGMDRE